MSEFIDDGRLAATDTGESEPREYTCDEMKDWLNQKTLRMFGNFTLTPERERGLLAFSRELKKFCLEKNAKYVIRNHRLHYDKLGNI